VRRIEDGSGASALERRPGLSASVILDRPTLRVACSANAKPCSRNNQSRRSPGQLTLRKTSLCRLFENLSTGEGRKSLRRFWGVTNVRLEPRATATGYHGQVARRLQAELDSFVYHSSVVPHSNERRFDTYYLETKPLIERLGAWISWNNREGDRKPPAGALFDDFLNHRRADTPLP